jgi:micrococcal nuclease
MYTYKATVFNVVDGDTIDVNVDLGFKMYTRQRIRLNRIDTPERGQPGFAEAGHYLRELIMGKEIILVTHKVSKWGHYLGDILLLNGEDINQRMIDEGLAKPYSGGIKL